MQLINKKAEVYKPSSAKEGQCNYIAIAAHQDDIEIMAIDGILKAFDSKDEAFVGVITTDGAGSARSGIYEKYTDEQMKQVRAVEQKKAAEIGGYNTLISLNYTSSQAKSPNSRDVIEDYKTILKTFRPKIVYTHNLCDKHDTHIAVVIKVIEAIRGLSEAERPQKVYGCEVWRNLDWLNDDEKVVFDVSKHQNLAMSLLGVFDSQISGGKRYDLATEGRRVANATYSSSHLVDEASHLAYAMDLTPLCNNLTISASDYVTDKIQHFKLDVLSKIDKMTK